MSKKPKAPADREAILKQARALLAEHFEHGVCVVSWDAEGTTYHSEFKFGNDYAAKSLANDASEILWPCEDEEEEDEEEEA
jgi:hypothetical protein